MPGPHDIGGRDFGPINLKPRDKTSFDKRVDLLQRLIGRAGARVYCVDELRRAIESLPKDDYYQLGYYERWLLAIQKLLLEKDILSGREIESKITKLRSELT